MKMMVLTIKMMMKMIMMMMMNRMMIIKRIMMNWWWWSKWWSWWQFSQYMPIYSLFDIHRCRTCITLCRPLKAVPNSLKSFYPKKLMARLSYFSKKTISCPIWISNLDLPSKLWQKWRKCHNDFKRQYRLSVVTQVSNLPLRNLDININTKHWLPLSERRKK